MIVIDNGIRGRTMGYGVWKIGKLSIFRLSIVNKWEKVSESNISCTNSTIVKSLVLLRILLRVWLEIQLKTQ